MRGDLATRRFVTVRGEAVDVLTSGVYRYNARAVAAEGVGLDAVTLFLVVPALFIALAFVRRGSLRATLFTIGLLAYLLYQYLEYAVFLAYGPLFLLYVATFALSLTAIALLVARIDLGGLGARFARGFPRRSVIALGVFMAVLLCAMWLPLVLRTMGGSTGTALAGATTMVVQAFDLGLLVPLGIATAVTVYRRSPAGYLLASVVVVKACAMATAIASMLVVEWMATGVLAIGFIAVFALTAMGSAILAVKVYKSVGPPGASPASSDPLTIHERTYSSPRRILRELGA